MNNLKVGASYILGFPQTTYKSIYKLIAIHNAVAHSDIVTTFIDAAGFKVMFTKGAYTNMSVMPASLPPLPLSPSLTSQNTFEAMPLPYETAIHFKDMFDDDPIPPIGTRSPACCLDTDDLYS